jgi:hypothetical protein
MDHLTSILTWRNGSVNGPLPFDRVLNTNSQELEEISSWICWAFPGDWRSEWNPMEPYLTKPEFSVLAADQNQIEAQSQLLRAYQYHLTYNVNAWQRGPDHNRRRITRVIKSLCLQGMVNEAEEFYRWCLNKTMRTTPWNQIENTLIHWNDAIINRY